MFFLIFDREQQLRKEIPVENSVGNASGVKSPGMEPSRNQVTIISKKAALFKIVFVISCFHNRLPY